MLRIIDLQLQLFVGRALNHVRPTAANDLHQRNLDVDHIVVIVRQPFAVVLQVAAAILLAALFHRLGIFAGTVQDVVDVSELDQQRTFVASVLDLNKYIVI